MLGYICWFPQCHASVTSADQDVVTCPATLEGLASIDVLKLLARLISFSWISFDNWYQRLVVLVQNMSRRRQVSQSYTASQTLLENWFTLLKPMSFSSSLQTKAIFTSLWDYGDMTYIHASASTLKPLFVIYHSAFRFITGAACSTHHSTLYSLAGCTSLAQRRDFHMLLFNCKAFTGKLHTYVLSSLALSSYICNTRSSNWLL